MSMKRAFAALAATAMMLSGMAFGSAGAMAADGNGSDGGATTDPTVTSIDDGTITLESDNVLNFKSGNDDPRANREFKYVKLADYKLVPESPTNGQSQYLTLETASGVKDAVIESVKSENLYPNYSTENTNGTDPLVWLTKKNPSAGKWSEFINGVKGKLTDNDYGTVTPTVTDSNDAYDGKATAVFDFTKTPNSTNPSGPGLYLLIDNTSAANAPKQKNNENDDCTYTYGPLSTILIGTKVEGDIANADGTLIIDKNPSGIGSGNAVAKTNVSPSCSGSFAFQKTGAAANDKDGLNNVTFIVKKFDDSKGDPSFSDYKAFDTEFDKITESTEATSATVDRVDGVVSLTNLTAGWYLIKEDSNSVPNGYLKDNAYLARLLLQVTQTGDVLSYNLTAVSDTRLFTKKDDQNKNQYDQYMDIQNIGQLPLTGAAGTAIFSAIAVLLVGAAGMVFLKSRKTKQALRY
ncbi:cell surface protein [Bifidobacterium goeldii]|uniref:Cell surface protein n=1 Tax=Bifidobacterium goeldii TaxID=2306975 RepID=A0A430FLU5_9BIFI|nr:LPXTG cell wall anchor domain-containing protein [Bifidobacterium goeldii]RSX53698.1 cell surface protein [Bifidobacterium goeldii]